jgi:curved DNA-binding protein CbpA
MAPTPATKPPTGGNGAGTAKGGTGGPAGAAGHVSSPSVSATRASPKAAPAAPTNAAIRAAILDMAAKLDKSTHFEVLGVGQSATADEISVAFVHAARQFHPDRLTSPGLSDLQPLAERILSRINEAVMILQNPGRRAEYLASLNVGPPQASHNLPTLLESENLFLKGEVFLKKGDHQKAIEAFTLASKGNPDEPQYRAYLAWTRFEDPHARKEVIVRETIKILDGVIKERPMFVRGHYWIGVLWKFLNESLKAELAFREAAKVDPSFIEASRELRLSEMRRTKPNSRSSQPEAAHGSGLMGKFWKK